jgi:hypothetical protein
VNRTAPILRRKILPLVILCFLSLVPLAAQTAEGLSLGLNLEGNFYTRSAAAMGGGLSVDYRFDRYGLGLRAQYNNDFNGFSVIEPVFAARIYLFELGAAKQFHLFAQTDAGLAIINAAGKETDYRAMAGVTEGLRIYLGRFYAEAWLREGYPYLFGAGLGLGLRFFKNQ